jgi:hypothetical protein
MLLEGLEGLEVLEALPHSFQKYARSGGQYEQ